MKILLPHWGYRSFLLFLTLCFFQMEATHAQFTIVNPDLTSELEGCNENQAGFRLIPNNDNFAKEAAAIWNDQTIDLDFGFVLDFTITLSSADPTDEADGFCFVLQDDGTSAIGSYGGYIGYHNASGTIFDQSLAVEIDVFNNFNSIGDNGTNGNDHMTIASGGNLANIHDGPVTIGNGDIVDGQPRNGTITWDPCTLTFTADFGGASVVWNTDIRTLFGANANNVTWGFTAGSAVEDADHDICISRILISPPCTETECDEILVIYGAGERCDNDDDDFDPACVSPCISDATNLGPYNGSASGQGASCTDSIICVASSINGWEFTLTAGENMELHYLMANLLYPIDIGTAGGTGNDMSCIQSLPLFPYEISFFVNGATTALHTVTGAIPFDDFTYETILLPSPIALAPGDDVRIRIDGNVTNTSCDLFELSNLSVHGCCTPCPTNLVELGPDQVVCPGEETTLTAMTFGSELVVSIVEASEDDAEEKSNDVVNIGSSDLDMVQASLLQTVGVRFNNLAIPQGAVITSAYIQFTANDSDSGSAGLTIFGEDVDDAEAFEEIDLNISSRPTTSVSADWAPAAWTEDDAGLDQRTTDLSEIVQAIVNRAGWLENNSMAFIFTGSGTRVAEAFDNAPTKAPKLVIQYETEAVGPLTYAWSTGATTESITSGPVNTAYTVTVTDANGCEGKDQVTVKEDDDCCSGVEVLIECKERSATLTAFINGVVVDPNLFNVQWTIAGTLYPLSQNPITVENQIGNSYSVIVSDLNIGTQDCSAGGRIDCRGGEKALFIFPNPSKKGDELFLSCKDNRFINQDVFYTITNESGQTVSSGNLVLTETTSLPQLGQGIYLMHVFNKTTGEKETIQFHVKSL